MIKATAKARKGACVSINVSFLDHDIRNSLSEPHQAQANDAAIKVSVLTKELTPQQQRGQEHLLFLCVGILNPTYIQYTSLM